jgi:hypothetical protein
MMAAEVSSLSLSASLLYLSLLSLMKSEKRQHYRELVVPLVRTCSVYPSLVHPQFEPNPGLQSHLCHADDYDAVVFWSIHSLK